MIVFGRLSGNSYDYELSRPVHLNVSPRRGSWCRLQVYSNIHVHFSQYLDCLISARHARKRRAYFSDAMSTERVTTGHLDTLLFSHVTDVSNAVDIWH